MATRTAVPTWQRHVRALSRELDRLDPLDPTPEQAAVFLREIATCRGKLDSLTATLKRYERSCEGCGGSLGGRADRRWCSAACRQRAWRTASAERSETAA